MNKRFPAIVLCLLLICSVFIPISLGYNAKTTDYINESEIIDISSYETDWWPMVHHDIYHTGFSTSYAYDYLSPEWTYKGTSSFYSPTVYQNKLFVGSHDSKVYCLNALTGELIWSYKTGGAVLKSPAVYNNRIFFGSCDNKVYCLDASDGDFIWSYKTMDPVCSSPTVSNGRVYVGSDDQYIYCLDASDGRRIWYYHNFERIKGSPTVFNDYVLYGVCDGNFVCLNRLTGHIVWGVQTGGLMIWGSPVIHDGNVFFGTFAHKMLCLNATTGAGVWSKNIGREILNTPAIADNKVYVVCYDDWRLFCLNSSNGDEIWRFKAGNIISGSPIVADGKVYFISNEHKLYCLNSISGELLWTYNIGGSITYGSPIIVNGMLYMGTHNKEVRAFRTQESNNPPIQPSITGPNSGKPDIKHEFVITSSDLDDNPISYFVDWGDGTNSSWIGEYNSGQEITVSHTWTLENTFIFKVKARDTFGFESDWSEFEIKISNPRTRISYHWMQLLDMFPILKRILDLMEFDLGK